MIKTILIPSFCPVIGLLLQFVSRGGTLRSTGVFLVHNTAAFFPGSNSRNAKINLV